MAAKLLTIMQFVHRAIPQPPRRVVCQFEVVQDHARLTNLKASAVNPSQTHHRQGQQFKRAVALGRDGQRAAGRILRVVLKSAGVKKEEVGEWAQDWESTY